MGLLRLPILDLGDIGAYIWDIVFAARTSMEGTFRRLETHQQTARKAATRKERAKTHVEP